MYGGRGDDTLFGNDGVDALKRRGRGGHASMATSTTTILYGLATTSDIITDNIGTNTMYGEAGNEHLDRAPVRSMAASATIRCSSGTGNSTLRGGPG